MLAGLLGLWIDLLRLHIAKMNMDKNGNLLPSATAEIIPPQGCENCLDGLQFRVAFSCKYKGSLTELSGGQWSLVALSLILAMLKFKPSPFYILDEVDAALDLSHTEHIGKVIKNHFKESQVVFVIRTTYLKNLIYTKLDFETKLFRIKFRSHILFYCFCCKI